MKRSASKCLAIFCILLLAKGIKTQQTVELSGSGDNEATTETYIADAVGSQTGASGIRAELTTETPTTIPNSGDNMCMCDCTTGVIFTDLPAYSYNSQEDTSSGGTDAPEELQETKTTAEEEIITEQVVDENSVAETTPAVSSDASKETSTDAGVTFEPSLTTQGAAVPSLPKCTTIGNFSSETDCHAYSSCSLTLAGDLESTPQLCPAKMAFNVELSRCTRDITACNDDGIVCTRAGTFADIHSNASYYWCISRRPLASFRKYHIDCEAGKVFVPQLGKCFIDINNLQNLPPNYGKNDAEDDEDIVKAELKQFKNEEKLKQKEQKLREKLEKKIQKELAKKAAKDAKEQAKLKTDSEEDERI